MWEFRCIICNIWSCIILGCVIIGIPILRGVGLWILARLAVCAGAMAAGGSFICLRSTGRAGSYYAKSAGELPWWTAVDFIIWLVHLFGFNRWSSREEVRLRFDAFELISLSRARLDGPPKEKSFNSLEANMPSAAQAAAWFLESFILRFLPIASLSE